MRGSAGEIGAAIAAGRKDSHVRTEPMQFALGEIERDDAATCAVFHDEIDHEIFDEKRRAMADRLLIQRMQHRMSGAIGCRAGALRNALTEVSRHAAERTLIDAAVIGARKRHTVMLKLDDCARRLLAHELDGILITQPIRTFDGVVHVPAPIILTHIAKGCADTALCRDRMAARRKEFRHACRGKSRLGEPEGGAQARTSGTDHNDVVAMIDPVAHSRPPKATFRTANTAAAPMSTCAKSMSTSATVFRPAPCT